MAEKICKLVVWKNNKTPLNVFTRDINNWRFVYVLLLNKKTDYCKDTSSSHTSRFCLRLEKLVLSKYLKIDHTLLKKTISFLFLTGFHDYRNQRN